MLLATRHAIYSAAVSTEETAKFMLLPSWSKNMTTKPYASLCRKYPRMCKFLGNIPSNQLQYAKVLFWNNIQIPLFNTPGNCRSLPCGTPRAGSASMLTTETGQKNLPKKSEAKWEIQNIHNHPYQTALGSEQHSGLNKFNKLPDDHPQAPEGPDKTSALINTDQPHNCNNDEAPQNSSSQNLTHKVKDY